MRIRAHPPIALRSEFRQIPDQACRSRRRVLRADSSASTLPASSGAPASFEFGQAAPDARATSLPPACRRLPSGRSNLWACAERSSATSGTLVSALASGPRPESRESLRPPYPVSPPSVGASSRVIALDEIWLVSVSGEQRSQFLVAESAPARSDSRSCNRSGEGWGAPRRLAPDSKICSSANWRPAARFRPRHRLSRSRPSGPDYRRRRRRHGPANSPVLRLHESSPAFPARRGSGCPQETKIA